MDAPNDLLIRRGTALALYARLLGCEPDEIGAREEMAELRSVLRAVGDEDAGAALDPIGTTVVGAGRHGWSGLFDQGRVSPYEMSYLRPGLGGHTGRLADVSGFYRAFGFRVPHDRPDHVIAELEFAALLALGEADAAERGDGAGVEVFCDASTSFLRDHLGGWLDLFADRIDECDPDGPHGSLARSVAAFVTHECERRAVVPHRIERIDNSPFAVSDDDADEMPSCGGCPALDAALPGT